jgi:glucoamylase
MRRLVTFALATVVLATGAPSALAVERGPAPGAPGDPLRWAPADKQGFGTATGTASRVWFTLGRGMLTEVFHPDLGTPSVRDLELVVAGPGWVDRERRDTVHEVRLLDGRGLTYQQVNTDRQRRYRITKTYVTDPRRDVVLIDVDVASLTGRPYAVYVLHDPALDNSGRDDRGRTRGRTLVATDRGIASALQTVPPLTATSSGFAGRSDGWTDLRRDGRMDRRHGRAGRGNVVQTGRTTLTGVGARRHLRIALAFGPTGRAARAAGGAALAQGFGATADEYAAGWRAYLQTLGTPASVGRTSTTAVYDASLMVLAALEDKTHRGAFVASPSMPWAWGDLSIANPSNAYHLVWPRDLYQIATALLAAGDRAAAERALTFTFERAQRRDGLIPKNVEVDGRQSGKEAQLDEVALPLVLAWQLGRDDAATYRQHVRPAAEYLLRTGPQTEQERWENQGGYSPGTIASEIAGLVCAADLARRSGDVEAAGRYEAAADRWRAQVDAWTFTTTGPLAPHGYYLRLSKHADPDAGTPYKLGDGGPSRIDQRVVVDPSFLELARLGIKAPGDPAITDTLRVVDDVLRVETANGPYWKRYTLDGYGERRSGAPWGITADDSARTIGRAWPLLAGERGEYELLAGRSADGLLAAVGRAANAGLMLPEQVWDVSPPATGGGPRPGTPTRSATPLGWTHAQLIRLAWSIDAGRPVERPAIVACRYLGACAG